jgi:hypothetical protein
MVSREAAPLLRLSVQATFHRLPLGLRSIRLWEMGGTVNGVALCFHLTLEVHKTRPRFPPFGVARPHRLPPSVLVAQILTGEAYKVAATHGRGLSTHPLVYRCLKAVL